MTGRIFRTGDILEGEGGGGLVVGKPGTVYEHICIRVLVHYYYYTILGDQEKAAKDELKRKGESYTKQTITCVSSYMQFKTVKYDT